MYLPSHEKKKLKIKIFLEAPEVLLGGGGVLKTCSKFTGEHLCRILISIKLLHNF